MNDPTERPIASRPPTPPVPGVVIVFSGTRPMCAPFPLHEGSIVLGRRCPDDVFMDDLLASRRHVEITRTSPTSGGWLVRDLGSLNGTRVDGSAVPDAVSCPQPPVVLFGRTVALAVADVSAFQPALPMRAGRSVVGPRWRASLAEVEAVAARGHDLLLVGERGSGKEVAATHFHAKGPRARGPLVPVHCAAIAHGAAERLFFGTARGALAGASAEARGYVHAAEGGVLLLHEVGELDRAFQAKLLRLVETRRAPGFGASPGRDVDLTVCFAAERALEPSVAAGTFDGDLLARISRSAVALPPLRERREEIPWLAELALEAMGPDLALGADLVEACVLRDWRGNTRELLAEIRRMARLARAQSRTTLRSDLLAPDPNDARDGRPPVTAEQVERALREAPSVSGAAQMLHIHRSHLYRLIRQFGIDLRAGSSSAP
jgi:transcriptional regulator of acetoin/glycerol metabolism